MTTLGGTRPRTDSLAWLDVAACKNTDPAVFFPGRGQSAQPAKDICRGCPVVTACLNDALAMAYELDHGVRGGTSRIERKTIRKNRRNRTA